MYLKKAIVFQQSLQCTYMHVLLKGVHTKFSSSGLFQDSFSTQPLSPEYTSATISNFYENSRRYSKVKVKVTKEKYFETGISKFFEMLKREHPAL
jgi:hypothetical protein